MTTALPENTSFYGDGGTIHDNTALDVEVHDGKVVAVWFRCATVPFKQHDVDERRVREMAGHTSAPLAGLVFRDSDSPTPRRTTR